jgi:hypothetical protein
MPQSFRVPTPTETETDDCHRPRYSFLGTARATRSRKAEAIETQHLINSKSETMNS